MTEPHTGSHPGKFACSAAKCEHGYLLNGTKDWITGARQRTVYVVLAVSAESKGDFGLFLVDRLRAGFEAHSVAIMNRKQHLGLRGLGEYTVRFRHTFVPAEHVLLSPSPATLPQVMRHYSLKRCGQAIIAVALAQSALEVAYRFLRRRYPASGRGGIAFQAAEFAFAEMYSEVQAAEQLVWWGLTRTIAATDDATAASSAAKLFATETGIEVTNTAVKLCGAVGTSSRLPLERFLRDARMLTVAGGIPEVQKATIARYLARFLG